MNNTDNSTGTLEPESPQALEELRARIATLEANFEAQKTRTADTNQLNLLVFDGSRDKLLAAFVMATGAAACGMEVRMFFTFWATAALRNGGPQQGKKSLIERAFGMMLPNSFRRTKLSQMHMAGVGGALMAREMAKKNVADLDSLIQTAADLGVTIKVCEMSMQLMGIRSEELIDYPELSFCGVASFVDDASRANTTLFL